MTQIVEKLRRAQDVFVELKEAADAIERLTAENKRLLAALENIVGAYAHDHHNCTAESLREIAARAINQQYGDRK